MPSRFLRATLVASLAPAYASYVAAQGPALDPSSTDLFAIQSRILRVPIRIDPGAALPGEVWPLGIGLPLPRDYAWQTGGFQVLGPDHVPVPTQTEVRTRWPSGAAQWIWVDFLGDPSLDYQLLAQPVPGGLGSSGLIDHDAQNDTLTMRTGDPGPVQLVFGDLSRATPTSIDVSGVELSGDGLGAELEDLGQNLAHLTGLGHQVVSDPSGASPDPLELTWTIEAQGPVRAVLRVEGPYLDALDTPWARAVVRYSVYAGLPYVFVDHTLVLTEESVTAGLELRRAAFALPGPDLDQSPGPVRFGYRDASGAPQEFEQTSASDGWIAQVDFPHFASRESELTFGSSTTATVTESVADALPVALVCGADPGACRGPASVDGWGQVESTGLDVVLALRDLDAQFPAGLEIDAGRVAVQLWSDHGPRTLAYDVQTLYDDYWAEWDAVLPADKKLEYTQLAGFSYEGSARTHELFFSFAPSAAAIDGAVLGPAFDRPPLAMASPAYLTSSGALWRMRPRNVGAFSDVELALDAFFDRWLERMDGFPMSGWFGWGQGPELRYFGGTGTSAGMAEPFRLYNVTTYNLPKHLWAGWIRSGDRDFRDLAGRLSRFLSDFKILHAGDGSPRKGLLTAYSPGNAPVAPVHWALVSLIGGRWDSAGQTTDYIIGPALGYLLADQRYAGDAVRLFSEAVADSTLDLFACDGGVDLVAGLSQLLSAYRVTQDPALEARIHELVDRLVPVDPALDPEGVPKAGWTTALCDDPSGTGLWQTVYAPHTLESWALYKPDHKVAALIDYFDLFSSAGGCGSLPPSGTCPVDKAGSSIVRAAEDLLAYAVVGSGASGHAFVYQNFAPHFLARAWELSGREAYRSAALAWADAATRWMEWWQCLPAVCTATCGHECWDQLEFDTAFSGDKNGFAFFAIPHALALAEDASALQLPYPYAACLGRQNETEILFEKAPGKEVTLEVLFLDLQYERFPVAGEADPLDTLEVLDPAGSPVGSVEVVEDLPFFWPIGQHTRRFTVPAAGPAGRYRIPIPEQRYLVLDSDAESIAVHFPEGTHFGHLAHSGYELLQGDRYYFRVEGVASFAIHTENAYEIAVFDEAGAEVEDQDGVYAVTPEHPEGVWSFQPICTGGPGCDQGGGPEPYRTGVAFVRFEGIPPVVASGDPARLVDTQGIAAGTPPVTWSGAPEVDGLVRSQGWAGGGLHLVGTSHDDGTFARAADLPRPGLAPEAGGAGPIAAGTVSELPQGTLEFFFRPDVGSREQIGYQTWFAYEPFRLSFFYRPSLGWAWTFASWLHLEYGYEQAFPPPGVTSTALRGYADLDSGAWYHVALTWDTQAEPAEARLFLDGRLVSELTGDLDGLFPSSPGELVPLELRYPQGATYDELRLSSVIRYGANGEELFAVPTAPHADDSDTVALFPFDEHLSDVAGAASFRLHYRCPGPLPDPPCETDHQAVTQCEQGGNCPWCDEWETQPDGSCTTRYDACSDARVIIGGGTALCDRLRRATSDGWSAFDDGLPDIWFRYLVQEWSGTLHVRTCVTHDYCGEDAGIDTILSVYDACPEAGGTLLKSADGEDDVTGPVCAGLDSGALGDASLDVAVQPFDQVWVRVAAKNETDLGHLRVTFCFCPDAASCADFLGSKHPVMCGSCPECP